MALLHLIILALVQGITEFLPISSSGHLVITHSMLGQNVADLCWEQNRVIDVAVHIGTLFSVLIYFRHDVLDMAKGFCHRGTSGFDKTWYMVGASIPVLIAGFLLSLWQPSLLCLLEITAWMTLIFGIVLWISDKFGSVDKTLKEMNWRDAMLIGLAQTLGACARHITLWHHHDGCAGAWVFANRSGQILIALGHRCHFWGWLFGCLGYC